MHGALLLFFIFNFTFIFINVFIEKKCADLQLWGLGVNLSFQFFLKSLFLLMLLEKSMWARVWESMVTLTCLATKMSYIVKFNLNDTCIITWLYVYLVV